MVMGMAAKADMMEVERRRGRGSDGCVCGRGSTLSCRLSLFRTSPRDLRAAERCLMSIVRCGGGGRSQGDGARSG